MHWYYEYLKLIAQGKPVSEEVRLALDRIPGYLNLFDYDATYPNKIIDFIEHFIYLQKGATDNEPMKLQVEQKFWIELMGFKHKDSGRQVINDIGLILGAGSGKSTFMAALGIAVMMVGSKQGNDVIIFANSIKQAQETFRTASEMVGDDRSMLYDMYERGMLKPILNSIKYPLTNSLIQVKAMDNRVADGVNVRLAIFDEFHAYRTNVIENVRKSSAPKRRDTGFTIWYISTNGQTRDSVFDSYYQRWEDILHGRVEDWSTFPMIYKLDDLSETMDESTYEKAMPFVKSISDPAIVKNILLKAKGNPVAQSEILAKSFNIPQAEFNALFTEDELKKARHIKFDELVNDNDVYIGFDLSSVNDLSSIALVKKRGNHLSVLTHSFLPEKTFNEKVSVEQRQRYQIFIDKGALELIPGSMIDEKYVFDWLVNYLHDNELNPLGFAGDAYYSKDFKRYLADYFGDSMVFTVAQNVANLSDPLKKTKAFVAGGHYSLKDDLITWSLSNLRVKIDANGNVYPNKEKAIDKIDPVLAMIQGYWLYNKLNSDEVWTGW